MLEGNSVSGENFVPMPIISVLSCEGILCLYVVNYLVPNAPNICMKPIIEPRLTYFTNKDTTEENVIPTPRKVKQPPRKVMPVRRRLIPARKINLEANLIEFSPPRPSNM